ncbi:MAG TPA: LacI family DNA-binding transcriptional regulator [Spirochaetia bacterium]|nr:LacI family DNA-binding transcriptional regulator [Spirochaetia bacterium]
MNIYDIAKEAGVSISTVSRVMNDRPNVATEKRERVLAVLKKHDYVPSAIAKSLVVKSTNTVGVVTLDVRHIHYAKIAYTIEQELSTKDYNVILCNTGSDKREQEKYLRVLAEKQVDGVIMVGSIFSSTHTAETVDRFLSHVPVIMHNGNLKRDNIYNISSNDSYGVELSVDYLVRRGYRQLVFVQDQETWVANAKLKAFRTKLEHYGLPFTGESVVKTENGLENGRAVARALADRGVNYDGVVGCEDITALGIMKELRASGKRIPQDVAVIGFNNSIFSELSEPSMTSVDNKTETIGIGLSRALVDVLQGRDVPHEASIFPELIIRESA